MGPTHTDRPAWHAEFDLGNPRNFRGLDLLDTEAMTDAEWQRHLAFSGQPGGKPLPSYQIWSDLGRTDVYKQWLNQVYHLHDAETIMGALAYLQYYIIQGWIEGVRYTSSLKRGYPKDVLVETVATAFLHSPSMGMVDSAPALTEILTNYDYQGPGPDWPSNFAVDPSAFKSGLDFSQAYMSDAELKALFDWYERTAGEVPASARLLAKHRPNLLKAWRGRFENVVKTGLPNQMFAYLLIHYEVLRLNPDGIREYVQLGRGLGMTKPQVLDALMYGSMGPFGGTGAVAVIDRAVGDLLDQWSGPA